jgi:hypothetical protein
VGLSPQSEELKTNLRTVRYSSCLFTELVQCAPFQVVVRVNNFRKVEDGCVDIYFYDWLYFGSYTSLLTFQLFNEGVRLPNQPFSNPIPQWGYFTLLTNDSEDICALLRGIPEFSIHWPSG